MKYELYVYRDNKSSIYGAPVPAINRACAVREFVRVCENSPFGRDMELHKVGEFDATTGSVTIIDKEFILEYSSYNPSEEV